jgi:methyltransferase family protein
MAEAGISLKKTLVGMILPKYSPILDKANWNARWLSTIHNARTIPFFPSRRNLHGFLNETYFAAGTDPIDYLEFGVYRGASLQMWTGLNKHPNSRFFGFDSFQGLPEDWSPANLKGTFNTDGGLPDIGDARVRFVVGWFQNSLPRFLSSFQPQHRLVIHMDCDLFSSALYCLATLNPLIAPETIIVFDEFDAVLDEYRALTSYASAFMRTYSLIAATKGFSQAAIQVH